MRTRSWTIVASLVVGLCASASASQLRLDVSMANTTLLAGKKQTTYIKIGLTGGERANSTPRAPVNIAIVLDKSGSMGGEKIERAKEAAVAAIERLNSNDIVSIVTYDSTVAVIVPATKLADKKTVLDAIASIQAGGSTALFGGVSKGAAEVRKFFDANRVNRVLLLSDGLANVGPQTPSELGQLGVSLMKEGIAVSTMGLGLGYNEDLMSQLAQKSGGNHAFIEHASNLVQIFNHEFDDVLSVVAQEIAMEIHLADGIRPVKALNAEAEINGQNVVVLMNQVYSQQEKYVLMEVEVPSGNVDESRPIADVKVSYSNLITKATDRLSSSVSVTFTNSVAVVDQKTNKEVAEACELQLANMRNMLATELRDKGDIEGAKKILMLNCVELSKSAGKLGSELLKERADANGLQAENLSDEVWARSRKVMRAQQYQDLNNQTFQGTKR